MKIFRFGLNLFFSLTLIASLVVPTIALAEEEDYVNVQILSVNDLHGKIDNEKAPISFLASYLKEYEAKNENTLIVHSGDMIGGSPIISALFQDEPTVEVMEAIGFDVGTLGNHEFDEGVKEMLRMVNGGEHPNGTPGYDGMDFPVVAANVQFKDTKELMLNPYFVQEIAGQKIGFIGVVTTETPGMIVQDGNENLEVTDEITAINKYVPQLTEQGVEAIVVLAHNPGYQEGDVITGDAADIANGVDDAVDVIVAAHNHVYNNGYVDNKLIVQAYEYGEAFAAIDLDIDPTTGDIVNKSAEVIKVDIEAKKADEEVAAILKKYNDEVEIVKSEVLGEAAVDLDGGYGVRGKVGDNALGNLLADAMKVAMDADFAFMNGGGIRDDIGKGDITFGDLFDVQPFGNTLVKAEFTGKEIRDILNHQISVQYGPDYSVAGLKYTWQNETQEVVDIFLPDGKKIKDNETYTLVVNNYMFGDPNQVIGKYAKNSEQGPVDLDATVEFVSSYEGPITYAAEGRISQVDKPAGDKDKEEPTKPTKPDKPSKPAKPEKPAIKKYIVKAGDSLWTIAKDIYGKGIEWKKIYEANKKSNGGVISNPNRIYIGQYLLLP
ncbi:5'-nucleotidase C-terminal domain-containing protein [Ornithinibacillus scapharcae]|uniref:5'-nucleotidase C-terminal domain-containing protein n=1 Tax=Ornithinibacillus scapharcae TaxID=1147159 RepID=UPI000225BCF9|nr:5'-nucleotidase C-terminal domain-containing protein [Ornithinibacillus scapharcae]